MQRYQAIITRADYDSSIVFVWARNARDAKALAARHALPWTRAGLEKVAEIEVEVQS